MPDRYGDVVEPPEPDTVPDDIWAAQERARTVDGLRSTLFLIGEARIDYDAACRAPGSAVAAQRFVDAVVSALDGGDQ